MLVGRHLAQQRIATLFDDALAGRSGTLLVRGDAGIGKTALLEEAVSQAAAFQVLRARGVDTESELDFAGLHELLTPIAPLRAQLPEPQAAAIAWALALGPAVAADRLAVGAGVVGILAAAAAERPVLAVIDDAYLLDRASAETIAFAARRLRDDRVAILIAIRVGETSALALDGIAELTLEPLDGVSAAALLDARREPLVGASRARVLELARGNPLALLELPASSTDPEAPSGPAELTPGSLLSRSYGRQVRRLAADTRLALAVAAASDDGALEVILTACRELSIGPESFAAAEAAGLIQMAEGAITFRHPLVRAAVYAEASQSDRRAAHRALADALVDRRTEDRWAWHRALAAVGPDEPAALALEGVAQRSSNAATKARALERAAHLTPEGLERAARLIGAALAAETAGDLGSAEALASEAMPLARDSAEVAELEHLLGRVWTRTSDQARAADILTTGAAKIANDDPDRAALMLADAIDAAIGDLDRAAAIAAQIPTLQQSGGVAEQRVLLRMGDVHGWRGDVEQAHHYWRRSADLAIAGDADSLLVAAEALFSAGLDEQAIAVAGTAADLARRSSALNVLTLCLGFIALAEVRRGRLRAALDAVTEELDLVVALGQRREERFARGESAWIEASLGHDAETRMHVERAAELERELAWRGPSSSAIAVVELAQGRADNAVAAFERDIDRAHLRSDAIAPRSVVPAYVEALVRLGRAAEAQPLTVDYEDVAQRSGRPLAIAVGRRCRGLVDASIADLRASAEALAELDNDYEAARSRLCLGELLRRQGDRRRAKAELRLALQTFDALGADAWADRARSELALLGYSVGARSPAARSDELTPQERNVARLVAEGHSNREIADYLFVTTNTVETHLRHIFQKLEVASRTQAAIRFREIETDLEAPSIGE